MFSILLYSYTHITHIFNVISLPKCSNIFFFFNFEQKKTGLNYIYFNWSFNHLSIDTIY